ncbi:hypothetical protein [Amycolatopsis sp. NPDC004079]|uniref:hypothetical protein n=1 Tax=Amycolatopsis sp. NPDC004079 TaxID=3154549 RepID=UPI0033A236B3
MKHGFSVRRIKLGLTLREIGEMLKVSPGAICNIEHGQHSSIKKKYGELLAELEKERLRELIEEYPQQAGSDLGDLANGTKEPPDSTRAA